MRKIIENKPLPVYGNEKYTRYWLYVIDHAIAIDMPFHKGINKTTYNIGRFIEWQNIDLIKILCDLIDKKLGREKGSSSNMITYIKDRPGH